MKESNQKVEANGSSNSDEDLVITKSPSSLGLSGNGQGTDEREAIQINELLPEKELIKSIAKYHPRRTRHDLAKILIISLVISIFIFGILHVVAPKEILEKLEDFSRYSITILSSLSGTALGFFFRDITDK